MSYLTLISSVLSPTRVSNAASENARGTRDGVLFIAQYQLALALEGRVYNGPHTTAQNTAVTGQTSFAATTPTFLLDVPSGTTALPMEFTARQSGTIAGGLITVIAEVDTVKRYSSAGTAETYQNVRTDNPVTGSCNLYSGPTALAGFGTRVWEETLTPSVSASNILINQVNWKPDPWPVLVGPATLQIFTFAASTGPTWLWTLKWGEVPTSSVN